MIDIIRHKQVSLNDLQEGEYVINEFAGQIKGVLKLNNKLHSTIFNEESNKAPLKSEQNNIVINDGISDRVIIGDIGKTKDGNLYGMKVSAPGHDARFASNSNLLVNTANKAYELDRLGSFYHKIYDDDVASTLASSSTSFSNTANDKDMFENLPIGTYIFILSANVQVSDDDVEGVLKARTHTPNVSGSTITGAVDISGGLRIHTGTDTTAYDASDTTDLIQYMTDVQIVTLTANKDIHMQYKRQDGSASGTVTFSDINMIAIRVGKY
jgi:hypothetical protein